MLDINLLPEYHAPAADLEVTDFEAAFPGLLLLMRRAVNMFRSPSRAVERAGEFLARLFTPAVRPVPIRVRRDRRPPSASGDRRPEA